MYILLQFIFRFEPGNDDLFSSLVPSTQRYLARIWVEDAYKSWLNSRSDGGSIREALSQRRIVSPKPANNPPQRQYGRGHCGYSPKDSPK
jgi:hypothetical protein